MADNEGNLALARARANAEAERRRRQAVPPSQTAAPAQSRTAMQNVNEFVAGVNRPLAGIVDVAMSPVALAREMVTGRPSRGLSTNMPQQGDFGGSRMAGAAGEYVGMAMPLAGGLPALGSTAPQIARLGTVQNFLNSLAKNAYSAPKTYLASEALSAGGAGMMGQLAQESGAGPVGQLAAEFGGAMAGGLPIMAPAGFRAAREGLTASLAPMSTEGGMIRAARQTQQRAGGQEAAQRAAVLLETIPGNVSPAQWIGDERLMAQEARLLADNPQMANQVKADLQDARIAAQESLLDSFGKPRTRQDWEKSVLEKVAPEGVVIQRGQTDEMLDEAYQAFTPLYDSAKGHPVNVSALDQGLQSSALDQEIIATDAERAAVGGWLKNQYSAVQRRLQSGQPQSDDLLEIRSRIRDERRSQSKRGNMERADLLGSAEAYLTQTLEQQLPEETIDILRAADSQYRKYKVVENAIYNAGDSALTPDQLSQSIRTGGLTSASRYARGSDPVVQELRIAALGGKSTEEVLGDPRRAALFVRGLDNDGRRAVQADFVNVLYNRAKGRATDATDAGVPLVSGKQLLSDINENKQVMARLGMSQGDIGRVENIAREITRMERRSPAAVDSLFTDGPASLLQLGAALIGAKSGQRMAGGGMGSSLVLAQYMSNRARRTLANLTSDEAERLMVDAATDPKLYKALLTKELVSPRTDKQTAQYLESWLLASAADKALAEDK